MVMKALSAGCLLLLSSSLFGALSAAQAPDRKVEKSARPAAAATRLASAPLRLFDSIPVSTHSDEARKSVELAIDKYENGLLDDAIVHAQHATEKDGKFALGYAVLSFVSRRGTPDAAALARAKALMSRAAPDEQLLVRWMISIQDGNLLPAIMNMNDLIQRYPKNEHVLYLTSEWLYFQQDYDRSRQEMENVLKINPDFSPALNILGHAYLQTGNPDPAKAIATLKRYVELQPGQPNAEESLGEILSQSGDDQSSVEHYGEALQLEPTYVTARVGLADTLTLMGNYPDAHEQYDRAISAAESARDSLHAEYQNALISLWEGNLAAGRKLLETLSEKARSRKEPYAQFEIGFAQALLAPNADAEFVQLHSLESSLRDPVAAAGMTEADRNASLAAVWRERARAYASSGQAQAADQTVHELEELAARTRDLIVENIYESAHGYALFAQGDMANAADELATDTHNPLVLRQLILAQEKLGNLRGAEASRTRLKYLRASTVEWFLVARPNSANAD
jgi:tetratricopeptide (TPR) repeat protein